MINFKKDLLNNITYYNEVGQIHRDDDLPAIEYSNGDKCWYQNGKRHRDGNLPAIEWNNGTKSWYYDDEYHRLDGPAIEWNNGYKKWYYQGEEIKCSSTEEFIQLIKLRAFW